MFSMLSVGKQSKMNKLLLSESRGCLAGSNAGCRLARALAGLSTYMLSFCVKAKGKMRGNYVGRWNEQIGVGGGKTCVWDKGDGKC